MRSLVSFLFVLFLDRVESAVTPGASGLPASRRSMAIGITVTVAVIPASLMAVHAVLAGGRWRANPHSLCLGAHSVVKSRPESVLGSGSCQHAVHTNRSSWAP